MLGLRRGGTADAGVAAEVLEAMYWCVQCAQRCWWRLGRFTWVLTWAQILMIMRPRPTSVHTCQSVTVLDTVRVKPMTDAQ